MQADEHAALEKEVSGALLDLYERTHTSTTVDDMVDAVRRLPPFGLWTEQDERMMLEVYELTHGDSPTGTVTPGVVASAIEVAPNLNERVSACAVRDGLVMILAAGHDPETAVPVLTLSRTSHPESLVVDSGGDYLGYSNPHLLMATGGDVLHACATRVGPALVEAVIWRLDARTSARELHWSAVGEVLEAVAASSENSLIVFVRDVEDDSRRLRLRRNTDAGTMIDIDLPAIVLDNLEEAWQPVIAVNGDDIALAWLVDGVDGCRLHYAWFKGDEWRHGSIAAVGTTYAVHPDVTWGSEGRLYLAFDELDLPGHGASGTTQYIAQDDVDRESLSDQGNDLTPQYRATCRALVCGVDTSTGELTELSGPLAERHRSVATYPTLSVDESGTLHLAITRRRGLTRLCYTAPIVHSSLKDGRWSEPIVIRGVSGGYRRPVLLTHTGGVTIVGIDERFSSRYRRAFGLVNSSSADELQPGLASEYLDSVPLSAPRTGTMIIGNHIGTGIVRVAQVSSDDVTTFDYSIAGSAHAITGLQPPTEDRLTIAEDAALQGTNAYWGDFHRHSALSRCAAGLDLEPEDHYYFAKNRLGLAFWALTDHAESITPFQWRLLRRLTVQNNRASCLTVPAFEWTSFRFGHLNVFGTSAQDVPVAISSYSVSSPEELWTAFDKSQVNVLTLPHHSSAVSYPTDWSVYTADRIDKYAPVVEVFQAATGSYEEIAGHRQFFDGVRPSTVTDALMRKLKLGLIASSDHRYGVSYIGLYRRPSDRAELFEMLRRRECFGGTQRGIVPSLELIDFDERDRSQPASFRVACRSSVELASVELVRNGEVEWARSGADGMVNLEISVRAQFGGARRLDGELRVVRGGAFVHGPTAPAIFTKATPELVRWVGTIPANRQGYAAPAAIVAFGVTLDGDAVLELSSGDDVHRFSVADVLAREVGTLDFYTGDGLTLAFGKGRGSLLSLGAATVDEDVTLSNMRGGDWVYVRALSVTGESAWTSPVWL